MFTGIVEALAKVVSVEPQGPARRIVIGHPETASAARLGDSIAINGCCLSVVEKNEECLAFEAGPETLARTNLGALSSGDRVNLERSLTASSQLGGHFVLGHIDATGSVARSEFDGEWVTMWVQVSSEIAAQLVPKGSVSVDGVSLTVVDVLTDQFSVALIPYTLEHTTLGFRNVGDTVNLETDILGKYIAKLIEARPLPNP